MEVNKSDNKSILLCYGINYDRKKIYSTGPGTPSDLKKSSDNLFASQMTGTATKQTKNFKIILKQKSKNGVRQLTKLYSIGINNCKRYQY